MQPPRASQQTWGWVITGWIHRFAWLLPVLAVACLTLHPVARAETGNTPAETMATATAIRQWAFAHLRNPAPASQGQNDPWIYVARWTVGRLYPVAYFRHVAKTGQLDRVFVMPGPGEVLVFDARAQLVNSLKQLPFLSFNSPAP
ncbi:MAG: hypothetical protein AB7P76_04760 [Candidatus Melainabacteria bacterium]